MAKPVVGVNDVGARSRNPDVAIDSDEVFAVYALSALQIGDTLVLRLQGTEAVDVETVAIGDGASRVAGSDKDRALLGKKARGVAPNGAEALHGKPRTLEPDIGKLLGNLRGNR